VPQPADGVTYAPKIDKAEARLDFGQDAAQVERQVRAFNPAPGAFFEFTGERVRVLEATIVRRHPGEGRDPEPQAMALETLGPGFRRDDGMVLDGALTIACAEDAIRPVLVQRAGRGVMTPRNYYEAFQSLKARSFDSICTDDRVDGRPFMGWQRQDHGPSVQQAIEQAAFAVTGESATAHAAGRTDAGVHALAMRAHVEIVRTITPFRLMEALNARLRPHPVAVLACEAVADDWHARFSCIGAALRISHRQPPRAADLGAGLAWRLAPGSMPGRCTKRRTRAGRAA
jgi:hypothetical protein